MAGDRLNEMVEVLKAVRSSTKVACFIDRSGKHGGSILKQREHGCCHPRAVKLVQSRRRFNSFKGLKHVGVITEENRADHDWE